MRKTILLLLLFSLFFISCEKNDSPINPTLTGKWNVMQIIGGFSQPKNYNYGSFTWEFDMNKKTVTIINTADVFTALDIPSFRNNQGGIYSFKIVEENGVSFLVVGNRKGVIKLETNRLTIDYGIAVDDIGYIFKR